MDNMYMGHLKSSEDQMDLMTMMMQLPDSSVANNGVVGHLPPEDFSCSISSGRSIHGVMPHFVDNPHVASSSFSNSGSTTISFGDDNPTPLLQDQVPSAFPSNSSNKKWGADAELSGSGNDYSTSTTSDHDKRNSMAAMREMIFRIAAMQPIYIDPESVKPPKRKNVKISKDPQSVAARHRRERISERIRILQRLVPGGTKMDTASMLDEAIHYVKFLKTQVQSLERAAANRPIGIGFPVAMSSGSYHSLSMAKANYCYQAPQNFHHYRDA